MGPLGLHRTERPVPNSEAIGRLLQDEYGLELNMGSYCVSILFSSFANAKKVKKRMPMAITDVIADVTKAPVPSHKKYLVLEAMLQDEDFEEVELPYVRLKLF